MASFGMVQPGTKIGPYDVVSSLGAGGMGEVYRAHDTRLKRDVAIKALPPEFARDPGRVARFRREAEALAALNHPRIAAIYDLLDVEGSQFLVLELVDGETLADRLARGRIPIADALNIARQIAEALEAAHTRAIVHRDLKPANVKLDRDGRVKVLDFGLAKASAVLADSVASGHPSALNSPTLLTPSATQRGIILGTAAYMSPEQARGYDVGPQADIWALGCVLFEMVTGRPCFDGRTVTDILAAVVRADPDWTALPLDTPQAVRTLLRRCLQKDVSERLHDAADVRLALDDAASSSDNQQIAMSRPVWVARRWTVPVGVAVLAALIAGAWLVSRRVPESPPELHLELTTATANDLMSFAISPDGGKIVYAASDSETSRLSLRALNESTPRPLPGTDLATLPFWSPDSRSIGFFADGKLKRLDIAGGAILTLADAPIAAGGTWGINNVIVYAPSVLGGLFRVQATGGQPVALIAPADSSVQSNYRLPSFLPDGTHFVFYARGLNEGRGIFVGSLAGDPPRRLADAESAPIVARDHLLFVRQGVLFAQRFDVSEQRLLDDPFAITEQIAFDPATNIVAASASTTGSLVFRTGGATGQRRLTWLDRSGRLVDPLGPSDNSALFNPELSPDGSLVVLQRTTDAYQDIWQIETTRGIFSRVTFDPAIDQIPVLSPDGRRVVFSSNRAKGSYDLYERVLNTPGTDRVFFTSSQNKFAMGFSRDGKFLLYRNTNTNTNWDLWVLPLDGKSTPQPVAITEFQEMMGEFSPDGRWIAYQTNESGQYEIVVQSFPEPGTRLQVSTTGGAQPRWRGDSKELFYVALDSRLMAVQLDVDSRGAMVPKPPVALFTLRTPGGAVPIPQKQQYAVARDGQRILVNMLTDEAVASPLSIILNWRPETR